MPVQWYVIRSKPSKEAALFGYLTSEGHEAFYPHIPANPVNPRARKVKPLFPGYLFVHTSISTVGRSEYQWMPFSQGLVRVGEEPAPVAEPIVRALQSKLAEIWRTGGLEAAECGLRHGDRILVREGIFEGYEGLFDLRLKGQDRARVLLKMVHDRYIPAELALADIARDDRGLRH